MRRDYFSVSVPGFVSNNLYRNSVENNLLLDIGDDMASSFSAISIEGGYDDPCFTSPSLEYVYQIRGCGVNRDILKEIIAEQNVIPVVKPVSGYVLEFVTECTFGSFLRLFILASNRYMEVPISSNKSATK